VLPDLVEGYNLSEHRSLPKGMSPKQASDSKSYSEVWKHQEQRETIPKQKKAIKISKYKGIFQKGYVANFSEEVFTVKGMDQRHHPVMYTIMDENGEMIEGKFYAHELQVVKPSEWFAIEKVIRRQGKKMLVKFLGYPGEYWVDHVKDINK
jgi:hypothetical protein